MFVKICGTTSEQDALLSVAVGADALGFIFAASPRQITAANASDIVKRLPQEILTVGVFRNETVNRIVDVVMQSGVRGVQLHGMESAHEIQELRKKLPLTIIKAFPAGSRQLANAKDFNADAVLLDAPNPGSGQVFDWRLADGVPDGVRLLLAGGLNPDNVAEAIDTVHPWGVDVVTGVESKPGKKDPTRLREFVHNAKRAAQTKSRQTRQKSETSSPGAIYDWRDDL